MTLKFRNNRARFRLLRFAAVLSLALIFLIRCSA